MTAPQKTESKSYDPANTEQRIREFWEKGGYFRAAPEDASGKQPFCMVIPPPNVTGALHLGHALNNTLQDILIRHKRMAGFNAFWLVGTDHAGIATQATVEKTIRKEEGKSRHDLGREELVRRIWEWKAKFGGRIIEQLKLMGCSCDYSRERFTLDEGCAKAVRETFFRMFRDGLIYRGKRLVNWDTQLQTAVSDDEVYHETVKGHFYHFKYPIKEPQPGEPQFVHIATTRPETMLGDTAVAVHPDPAAAIDKAEAELKDKLAEAPAKDRPDIEKALEDLAERRTTLLPTLLKLRDMACAGRKILLPLMDREIPLICDEWADPALGTGCVKITPAHDANDYDVGRRHDLAMINVMTPDGRVNEQGGKYAGQKFPDARKHVVADLEALCLVEKIEERQIDLGHSDRSKSPIEPYLSDQWFVRMGDLEPEHAAKVEGLRHKAPGLAQMAIDAVKRGDVKFHPPRYENTYVDWLNEKRDWCISRQLWWGHRIPVWTLKWPLNQVEFSGGYSPEALQDLSVEYFCPPYMQVLQKNEEQAAGIPPTHSNIYCCLRDTPAPQDRQILTSIGFVEDPDVLDTWFSSALWPHSTLGWPGESKSEPRPSGSGHLSNTQGAEHARSAQQEPLPHGRGSVSLLDYYYPTSVLSTAREIITLWVARMVITGLYNMGEVPFRDVVIHSVIQDGQGRKMSKTAGNGVDPVDIIEEYGADALRFTLADLATETQDIRLPVKPKKLPDGRTINVSEKFEKGRNFCNKLWQAATGYVLRVAGDVRIERGSHGFHTTRRPEDMPLFDRWIRTRLSHTVKTVSEHLDNYRFAAMMDELRSFFWTEFCDWYIEESKSRMETGSESEKNDAKVVLLQVLDICLALLHPSIPFITEAIWERIGKVIPRHHELIWPESSVAPVEPPMLVVAPWPKRWEGAEDELCERDVGDKLQPLVRALRDIRMEVNDHRSKAKQSSIRSLPSAVIRVGGDTKEVFDFDDYHAIIKRLGGCDALTIDANAAKPSGAMSRVLPNLEVYAPVSDLVDLGVVKRAEADKLEELRTLLARELEKIGNADFVRRADPAVVAQARQRIADLSSRIRLIESHCADMS